MVLLLLLNSEYFSRTCVRIAQLFHIRRDIQRVIFTCFHSFCFHSTCFAPYDDVPICTNEFSRECTEEDELQKSIHEILLYRISGTTGKSSTLRMGKRTNGC